MKWYYPPKLGGDLNNGFNSFVKHDDSVDEHLESLLKTIIDYEQRTEKKIDAQVVTWRGMMTKVCGFGSSRIFNLRSPTDTTQIMAAPFDDRDG
jgi:hypothetical protein